MAESLGVFTFRRVVLAVILVALLALAPYAWVRLSARGHIHTATSLPPTAVAIVFGAGLTYAGDPSPFLADRLAVAANLFEEGSVRVILVSGDNRFTDYDEPTAMHDWLLARGIPAGAIVRDYAGRDTYDTCVRAVRIFDVHEAVLVTQGYHAPRAVATCRAVGMDANSVPDWSAERFASTWRAGQIREVPASVKTVFDVLTNRQPVLGQPETGVTDALARED